MNSENNSFNNGQNVTAVPVVNNNVVATTPVVNNVPTTQVMPQAVPYTAPVVNNNVVATTPVVNNAPTTQVMPQAVPYTAPVVNNNVVATTPVENNVPTTQVVPQAVPYTAPVVNNNVVATTQPPILEPTPIVEPSTEIPTVPVVAPQPQPDNNTMVNENLRKVEIKDYNPPSKFKIVVLLFFFALIIAFIIFLPQISSYIRNYSSGTSYQKEEEIITTGKLICTMDTNTTYLDKEYEFDFSFTDSKLKRTKYIVYTRGDSTTETLLDETAEKCKTLKEETKELDGVTIKCDYSDGKLTETQIFELEVVDTEKLNAAFTEAGGILPSYKYDQDIDDIETNMKASGYTCERQK